ncbi:MAG: glycerol-3-phosphate dehydrogenase/oxidase, partial [Planctomycetota bacterium]
MHRLDLEQVRARRVEELAAHEWDVLVVGGGIVGAGVARDAAMRRLRVALVEQHDLAFGTSSRSSRLLHGGLRYLAQGRIGLVWEASREKRTLHRIAPHLAEPLAFVFPTYRGTDWPLWKLAVGVKLYDLLCGRRNLGPSAWMGRSAVLEHLPGVDPDNLTGAVRYYDALTNDARLVLDTLRSAAGHGATIANYIRLEEASPDGNRWRCGIRDVLSGAPYEVTARSVVHAAGPWAEILPQSSIRLRLTKGVHLVADRSRLPVLDAVVVTEGKRILFVLPWGERVILGTTDTDYDGPIEAVRTEPADIDYILGVVNRGFPSAKLTEADVLSHWASLRPLIADESGGPSDISRAHQICMPRPGWLDVAGGKLTTYRLIAQQVVDRVTGHLGREAVPCRTAVEPLLEPETVRDLSGIL